MPNKITSSSQLGKKPKYGYARDIYGRVQKRDLFSENDDEFNQSYREYSNYDYSSYDREDDHDSYYNDQLD